MAKKKNNKAQSAAEKTLVAMRHAERKLHQDLPRHQVIPNKKAEARKKACRLGN